MMCDSGQYIFWIGAVATNAVFIVMLWTSAHRISKMQGTIRHLEAIWHRRLDELDKIKKKATAERDQWKVANMLADAVNKREPK